jgi:hypothetical protein
LHRQVLARHLLAGRGKLGSGAERGDLRGLATRVRVDLGTEDQHVRVATLREDVIEAAMTDVVRPTVASHQPHAAPAQEVGERVGPAFRW